MTLNKYSQNIIATSSDFEKEKNYWLEKLNGEIEMSGFITNSSYCKSSEFETNSYKLEITGSTYEKILNMGKKSDYAIFMILLSGVEFLLSKYNDNEDIIIGMPIFKQTEGISYVNNIVALRNSLKAEMTFKELIKDIKLTITEAQQNQNFPFEKIAELLNMESKSLFRTIVLLKNIHDTNYIKFTGADIKFLFELNDNSINLEIEYNLNIFRKDFINQIGRHLLRYYDIVTANTEIRLVDINILDKMDEEAVLSFNDNSINISHTTVVEQFEKQAKLNPDKVAIVYEQEKITYKELNDRANQLANYLIEDRKISEKDCVAILIENSLNQVIAVMGTLKAGATYIPIDVELPEERIRAIVIDANVRVIVSSKNYIRALNRIEWECRNLEAYICIDTDEVYDLEEEEKSNLMNKKLWEFIGNSATDQITGGGWSNSYTGENFTKQEMDEYGDNALKKLLPYLNKSTKVLEIGCASGISMYRIAPLVGMYYGTDLSEAIINANKKKNEQENIRNIKLKALPAHEIEKVDEDSFDIIIINSVLQCFHGHNYLKKIFNKMINLLNDEGIIFVGDIMDQDSKQQLVSSLYEFNKEHLTAGYRTKTDWSEELFLSKDYFNDLQHDFNEIFDVKFSEKIYTIENELTKFRYDAMLFINKKENNKDKLLPRIKYQHDINTLMKYGCEKSHIEISPNSIAYIIYTSGTTGVPKGVMIEHKSLVNLCLWHNNYYSVTEKDNSTRYAGFGFDASVWELFPSLVAGVTIHVISKNIRLDIDKLNEYYEANNISISFLPTQICEQFQRMNNSSLRYLLTGGDKLKFYSNNNYKLVNNYGPTENTVVTTSFVVENEYDNVPIGKPISNVKVYIIDKNNQLQPIGAKGELCISGIGLASGYVNNDKLNQEKFVNNPFEPNSLMYKTGDLASWLPSGDIQFLGRNDQQVKIRAYRIELSDIENKLNKCEYIKEAVVIARDDENGNKYLCAYYVSDKELELEYLKCYLATQLPDYMIPPFFVKMDSLPLTINGKINKKQLPEPEGVFKSDIEYIAPRNEIEKTIAKIWSEVLNISKIGINDNFFDLGGNSLKAIKVISKMATDFEVEINQLFNNQTISEFSKVVKYKKDNFKNNIEKVKKLFMSSSGEEDYLKCKEKSELYIKSLDKYKQLEILNKKNNYKNILLVGGTGYLGSNLLYDLLKNTNSNVYLLIRAKSIEEAKERIINKTEHIFKKNIVEEYRDRVFLVCGDLTKEKLGLSDEEYKKLSSNINCILNAAATVVHYGHYDDFYEVNVRGVERLIDLAISGNIRDFNHVSTTGVASGKLEGEKQTIFTEDDCYVGQVSENYYIQTKLEAEKKVLNARSNGLNVNIFRVGNLFCNSETGIFQENIGDNGFYKIIKAFIRLKSMPSILHTNMDFSFIDYVSKAIVLLVDNKELKNEIYHVFNPNYVMLPDLIEMLRECDLEIKTMDIVEFLDYLCENYDNSEKFEYIQNFILHSQIFDSLENANFIILSDKTTFILEKIGFKWPKIDCENIHKMIDHCREVEFI